MRTITREELAACHGQSGAPAYVACEGRVYDVTGSFLWQRGRHQVSCLAGVDHTEGLARAPHGIDLLERYPLVGLLTSDD